jgi:hypothetical protein
LIAIRLWQSKPFRSPLDYDNQNWWLFDNVDEVRSLLKGQFWFWLLSMDWDPFFIAIWEPLYDNQNFPSNGNLFPKGTWKCMSFIIQVFDHFLVPLYPFEFHVSSCTHTTIMWNPWWVEVVKSLVRDGFFSHFVKILKHIKPWTFEILIAYMN